jgi:phosphoribosylamine---glycine ligase
MRAAIASTQCSLSLWLRLLEEGWDVRVWMNRRDEITKKVGDEATHVGDGMVEKLSTFDKLLAWAQEEQSMMIFDAAGLGDKADAARKAGVRTIGGGGFMDKLEENRTFGQNVVCSVGCELPPYEEFSTLSACRAWADSVTVPVYFKTDRFFGSDCTYGAKDGEDLMQYLDYLTSYAPDRTRCIVQKKIEGVPYSTGRWWNGRAWVGPYCATLEHKKLLNGDIGPSTGCALNAVWFHDGETIAQTLHWDELTTAFLRNEAPAGWYDINVIIDSDGKAYFLEWTPRFGYDSEMTGFRLYDEIGRALWWVATGQGGADIGSELAYSFRLTVPPYPWDHTSYADQHTCIGVPIHNEDGLGDGAFIPYQVRAGESGLEVAGTDGIVGLSLAVDGTLTDLHAAAQAFAESLRVPGLCYRTDGAEVIKKDATHLRDAGYEMHKGLFA